MLDAGVQHLPLCDCTLSQGDTCLCCHEESIFSFAIARCSLKMARSELSFWPLEFYLSSVSLTLTDASQYCQNLRTTGHSTFCYFSGKSDKNLLESLLGFTPLVSLRQRVLICFYRFVFTPGICFIGLFFIVTGNDPCNSRHFPRENSTSHRISG